MNRKELQNNIEAFISNGGMMGITLVVLAGLYIIYELLFSDRSINALGFAVIPLAIAVLVFIIRYYHRIFYLLFLSHFLFLLASSFVDLKIGVATLTSNLIMMVIIIVASIYQKTSWKESRNGMLLLFGIWTIYCVLEMANPNAVQAAWTASITNYFVYPVICAVLVPMTIRRYRNIEWLLIIWSVFIILAVAKGYWQKTYGFNAREMVFLFEKGGAETHIIWSGIRYFSYFTDAANYGVHMAMAVLGFSILAYFIENRWLKIYFFMIALLALYGMLISGTRASIAVPIGGLVFFTAISRSWKTLSAGIVILSTIFIFFHETTIGESNQHIRRMRSAFHPKTDASYQVRVQNRELMKQHLADKPFGYGLGLGGKASRYSPKEAISIPPDSWLINVWTDTGIVGVSLYVILHIILFAWCSWILMFKLSSKRLRNLLAIWLCMNAGFFIAAYANDVMQYPNVIIVYTGFAICFAAPNIEKEESRKVPLPHSTNNDHE